MIIKGTQVYDSSRGAFVDLSVLDVLQIFGRAGRPGLETSGEGYICTAEEKLPHYLDAIMSQHPIESQSVFSATKFHFSQGENQIQERHDRCDERRDLSRNSGEYP